MQDTDKLSLRSWSHKLCILQYHSKKRDNLSKVSQCGREGKRKKISLHQIYQWVAHFYNFWFMKIPHSDLSCYFLGKTSLQL